MQTNYNTPFKISKNIGNNVFCFNQENKTEIHVPSLIQVNLGDFKNNITKHIKIWENTSFREEKKWEIIEYKGLNNFIQINNKSVISSELGRTAEEVEKSLSITSRKNNKKISPLQSKWQHIYIFDNHNHALYFRYKEYFKWNIKKWTELIHIDQHSDMNENSFVITDKTNQAINLEDIFQFTNYKCNVWNFIKPAIQDWLISTIHQINTEYSLLNNKLTPLCEKHERGDRGDFIKQINILDIDLDFRAPEMSIQKYQETINIIKNLIKNSRVVTIATSPYFLNQNLATKIIQDLFQ